MSLGNANLDVAPKRMLESSIVSRCGPAKATRAVSLHAGRRPLFLAASGHHSLTMEENERARAATATNETTAFMFPHFAFVEAGQSQREGTVELLEQHSLAWL